MALVRAGFRCFQNVLRASYTFTRCESKDTGRESKGLITGSESKESSIESKSEESVERESEESVEIGGEIGEGFIKIGDEEIPLEEILAEMGDIPDYIEHARGQERKELILRFLGHDDPFGDRLIKRGPGTKDNPNIVYSYEDQRIIGCICNEDSPCVNWLWVHLDDPRRCECGYWFKLEKVLPPFAFASATE